LRSLLLNAGGESSRIKKDFPNISSKCWLEINEIPIIIKVMLELRNYVNEIIIVVKDINMKQEFQTNFQNYNHLCQNLKNYSLVTDDYTHFPNDYGPLLSIKSGLHVAKYDIIINIPSDVPFITTEMIKIMEKTLEHNSIVSIESPKYFNGLFFITFKQELLNLSVFKWKRVTDIYRLFPNINFIHLVNEKLFDSIHGINTKIDYENMLNISEKFEKTIGEENIDFIIISMNRKINILNEQFFTNSKDFYKKLFSEKAFFLLLSLSNINKDQNHYTLKELLENESFLWKSFNELIHKHILDDLANL
jgi:molybdopterin-guanine dinucleotide biosynthesis protein A